MYKIVKLQTQMESFPSVHNRKLQFGLLILLASIGVDIYSAVQKSGITQQICSFHLSWLFSECYLRNNVLNCMFC